jgi:NADH:ubiquinone oxidoreductase subunit 4 (subunit M)
MLSFITFLLALTVSITVSFFFDYSKYLKICFLLFSSITCIYSVRLFLLFVCSDCDFQKIIRYWVNYGFRNLHLEFGLNGISFFLFILSSLLIFLCVSFVFTEKHFKYYLLNLFIIELLLLLVFSVLDILLFYIFFEVILIPMYLVIGICGSRERKNWSAYMLFFYTLCGSLLLLLVVLYVYKITEIFNFEFSPSYNFSHTEEFFLWLAFFLSFLKVFAVYELYQIRNIGTQHP